MLHGTELVMSNLAVVDPVVAAATVKAIFLEWTRELAVAESDRAVSVYEAVELSGMGVAVRNFCIRTLEGT